MNKRKILVLSDLWGAENADWITNYIRILDRHFEVVFYDSCELGDIDIENNSANERHNQFVSGGIDKAVLKLLQIETEPFAVLAFSIGGTIAWKAALSGFVTQYLFAVSSTRLRFETQKPPGSIQLFYGDEDAYKPKKEWFAQLCIEGKFYENQSHEFYKSKETAIEICSLIISATK